jgi:hypothetical protein
MGPHNLLFWMSLAAGVAALCLIALLKIGRGAAPANPHVSDSPDLPPDRV